MAGRFNTFYIKYVRSADPGWFLTRYAGKAVLSCLVAFLCAFGTGFSGPSLFWSMVGAVLVVLFRTGSTLKRRKGYALVLLGMTSLTVPAAAVLGGHPLLSLVFIFVLSFFCFFVSSAGLSASKIGTGCLIATLISIFAPVEVGQGILRSGCLVFGGLVSFLTHFFIVPFDPEKALSVSARLALEDMAYYLDRVSRRITDPGITDAALSFQNSQAVASIRRYRMFLESFSIDPFKGADQSGGPGLLYFSLVRVFEAISGLSNHIQFSDNRPEFDRLRQDLGQVAKEVSRAFLLFSSFRPDRRWQGMDDPGRFSESVTVQIDRIRQSLLIMGGYKSGDRVRETFQEAWAAVYGLKTVWAEFGELKKQVADTPFMRQAR